MIVVGRTRTSMGQKSENMAKSRQAAAQTWQREEEYMYREDTGTARAATAQEQRHNSAPAGEGVWCRQNGEPERTA
jgi:hypothetical protein